MKRYYFALTNACNRRCELCSCHSEPGKRTFISEADYYKYLECDAYEVQLEGGEPLLHPNFYDFVKYVQNDPRCLRLILCTNTVKIPWKYRNGLLDKVASRVALIEWFKHFDKKSFTIKPSINRHLIECDTEHFNKMSLLQEVWEDYQWRQPAELIFNVRRLKNKDGSPADNEILAQLEKHNLLSRSQIYFYQRYGKAENNEELDEPFIISNPVDFHLISPDGLDWNTGLIKRAEHMKKLK